MADLNKCPRCNATKTILSLGNIKKKCEECNGVGWVNPFTHADIADANELVETVIKRKPGRKPKVKTDVLQVGV